MNHSSLDTDEEGDKDSLFGSPPPSTARGRSPSQEALVAGDQASPVIAVPGTGLARKNVGTIALPGSHMSCAELPANLPAPSLSISRPTSSHLSPSLTPPATSHTPVVAPRSRPRSVSSRPSSTASPAPSVSTSATIKKRRATNKKTQPAPSPSSISLPGPNEPTPPNFLRSQSSLLGLAGLVGCVKPTRLYTHPPQPTPTQHHPIRGSTPAHPIVLDDDSEVPPTGEQSQMPHRLDQLNPEMLRSNILSTLVQEKNIFPVLESLIKLLGGEPILTSPNPPRPPFARPYGHPSTAHNVPPKRRKLKHVPAGAVDWDVPFPFAAGEGPEGYRNTWAQDRAKQLVTQLLQLVQNATKRAAIKTARGGENASKRQTRSQSQSSSSASVETRSRQTSLAPDTRESSFHGASPEGASAVTPSTVTLDDNLYRFLRSLESPSAMGTPRVSKDELSADSGDVEDNLVATRDYSTFEEWLSQLQRLCGTCSAVPFGPSTSDPASNIHSPTRDNAPVLHATADEAIDPTLLAIPQPAGLAPPSQPPMLQVHPHGDILQAPDISTLSPLTHSPHTSLSSLTEPLTPLSEPCADAHPDGSCDPADQDRALSTDVATAHATQAQKGKSRADVKAASEAPFTSSRPTPGVVSTSKGVLDKQTLLERARERRHQLVAEIERAKMELWETCIEHAVLVHFMRDGAMPP